MQTEPTAPTDMNTQKKTHTEDRTTGVNVARVGKNESTVWSCNRCGIGVTLFVAVQYPPTHKCFKKAGRILPLQKEGEPNE